MTGVVYISTIKASSSRKL